MRNRMLRSIFTLCISAGGFSAAQAQYPMYIEPNGYSLGTTIGLADLWSDVGTKSIVDHYTNGKYFDKPCFIGGLFIRYSAHPSFAVRLGMNYGTLYATDKWNENGYNKATSPNEDAYQRYIRNLDTKANIWEGNFLFEITPLRFGLESKIAKKRMQPYLLFGVSAFHFKPTAYYTNRESGASKWVNTYNLHLEGEDFDYANAPERYSLWQMNVPLGLGVRWDIGYQLGLGIEYCYRYCFTDYLDGVSNKYVDPAYFDANLPPADARIAKDLHDKSWLIDKSITHKAGDTRGNSAVKDAYSTLSVTFFYKIKRKSDPWWN